MNILLLSQNYPPYIGGSQLQLKFLANELTKKHRVTVAIISSGATPASPLISLFAGILARLGKSSTVECILSRGEVLSAAAPRVLEFKFSIGEKLRILLQGRAARSRILGLKIGELLRDADVVHCIKPDWISRAAHSEACKKGVPFAITPYIHNPEVPRTTVHLLRSSDVVFYLTDADKRVLLDLEIYAEKLRLQGVAPLVLPDGDATRFRKRYGLSDHPIILFLGRMVAYKGVPLILAAREEVWARHPDARFVFAGPSDDDSFDEEIKRDGKSLALGSLSEEEKADAIAACDVFCMPSKKNEILPAVYLEAWTYRKPVIGGTAEGIDQLMIQSGGGYVSREDPGSLGGIIVKLLGDKDLRSRLGEAGHAFVAANCALPVIADRLADAYSQAQAKVRTAAAPEASPKL